MTTSDPFAAMVSTLAGAAAPPPSRAETTAARLGRAAELLRRSGDQAGLEVADAIDRWLVEGGDLRTHLGVKARPGRARDVPAIAAPLRQRDAAIRALAARVREGCSPGEKARFLATFFSTPSARAIVLREVEGEARVPTSARQLVRILRAVE